MKILALLLSIVLLTGLMTACPSTELIHGTLMRGQVVHISDGKGVVCIGAVDGAEIGQQLDAYRIGRDESLYDEGMDYTREMVGQITISVIIDEHFARFDVMQGELKKYDVVEL